MKQIVEKIQTVTFDDFTEAFHCRGRGAQFSADGLRALFSYIEYYEECTGEEMELDVVALCCDFTEYASIEDAAIDYRIDTDDIDEALEELRNRTVVIPAKNGVIIQNI